MKIIGNKLKLSQYVDDTNLLYADLASIEKGGSRKFWSSGRLKTEPQRNESDLAGKMGKKQRKATLYN